LKPGAGRAGEGQDWGPAVIPCDAPGVVGFIPEAAAFDLDEMIIESPTGNSMHLIPALQLLAVISVANGAPVLAKKIFGKHFSWPLDAGFNFTDGRPILGNSKTVRGGVAAIALASAFAPLIGLSVKQGAIAASFAMIGDVISSFTKRRIGLRPSSQAIGLDQIPESLLPFAALGRTLNLSPLDVAAGVALFLGSEVLASRLLYEAKIRDEPY
jgi:CDP-archaeol synthase